MTSGPIMVQVLEGENAVQRHRDIMGATNPDNALAGTLRADFLTVSPRMRYMALMLLNLLNAKSRISLRQMKFSP